MSKFKRHDAGFKQSIVNLYQIVKTQAELCKDSDVSQTALSKCIKQYSQVKLEDNKVMSAKQIQELQKRKTPSEEENLITYKSLRSASATIKGMEMIHALYKKTAEKEISLAFLY